MVSIRPLSCLHQVVYKSSTTSSSNTSLFPAATLHRRWFFSNRPGILSTHIRSSEITWISPVRFPLTTPLYLLSSTNMLPSSTNSPGASLHQTHGFPPPFAHFGPPLATLKTSGNVLTLLLTGPPSSLSATNTTSSSCFLKRVLLQPRIFSLRQPQTSLANSQ